MCGLTLAQVASAWKICHSQFPTLCVVPVLLDTPSHYVLKIIRGGLFVPFTFWYNVTTAMLLEISDLHVGG